MGTPAIASVQVTPLDLNGQGGLSPQTLSVTASYSTLQQAADAAKGGDLIVVQPGTYAGFSIGDKADAGDGSYIHFKALGNPGQVIINAASPLDSNWMIYLLNTHHIIIEGFNITGNAAGPRAGIFLNGNFPTSSQLTHHIVLLNNYSHDHRSWGMHSVDSHTVLMQGNLFSRSNQEHGAYVSDSSDNYVIRRNVFADNNASGLQVNLDPEASLDKVITHPKLSSFAPAQSTRKWATDVVAAGEAIFGAHRFIDGRGVNFIIEENVSYGNGAAGGAAINLAALSDSLIQNNIVYNNRAGGIVQWDNGNRFDAANVSPGPQSPSEVTGPDSLPFFGCRENLIRNNTVVMDRSGRAALQCSNGSWGCRLRNNVFVNGTNAAGTTYPSIEITNTSIYKLDAANNVLNHLVYANNFPASLLSLAISLPDEPKSSTGISIDDFSPLVVKYGVTPWVTVANGWWTLNSQRPDFRPLPGSTLLVGKGDPTSLPARDFAGRPRQGADIGALTP